MLNRAFSLLYSILFIGLLSSFQPANATQHILLLGDSLSASYGMKQNQGWVWLLNQQLEQENARYRIVNASISGETTGGGLSRLPQILKENSYQYLLIELGGNDGLRGFPPKLIENNLLQIIKLANDNQVKPLLMSIRIPPNYGPRYNQMFADVFTNTAAQTETPLLPFFVEQVATNPENMQSDGIHPTAAAQPMLVSAVKAMLEAHIK